MSTQRHLKEKLAVFHTKTQWQCKTSERKGSCQIEHATTNLCRWQNPDHRWGPPTLMLLLNSTWTAGPLRGQGNKSAFNAPHVGLSPPSNTTSSEVRPLGTTGGCDRSPTASKEHQREGGRQGHKQNGNFPFLGAAAVLCTLSGTKFEGRTFVYQWQSNALNCPKPVGVELGRSTCTDNEQAYLYRLL